MVMRFIHPSCRRLLTSEQQEQAARRWGASSPATSTAAPHQNHGEAAAQHGSYLCRGDGTKVVRYRLCAGSAGPPGCTAAARSVTMVMVGGCYPAAAMLVLLLGVEAAPPRTGASALSQTTSPAVVLSKPVVSSTPCSSADNR